MSSSGSTTRRSVLIELPHVKHTVVATGHLFVTHSEAPGVSVSPSPRTASSEDRPQVRTPSVLSSTGMRPC